MRMGHGVRDEFDGTCIHFVTTGYLVRLVAHHPGTYDMTPLFTFNFLLYYRFFPEMHQNFLDHLNNLITLCRERE